MTWVKICGITSLEDARMAVEAGADALGFVFYKKSPRYLAPEAARAIIEKLPEEIEKIGVFAGVSPERVRIDARHAATTGIQVHADGATCPGKSDFEYCFEQLICEQPHIKLMPVLSMRGEHPEQSAKKWNPEAVHAFLLDSTSPGQPGGTGRTFDWSSQAASAHVIKSIGNIVVAGGLSASNVVEAMRILKPWGVDVASGVEAGPGKKDPDKVRAFICAVREGDREISAWPQPQ